MPTPRPTKYVCRNSDVTRFNGVHSQNTKLELLWLWLRLKIYSLFKNTFSLYLNMCGDTAKIIIQDHYKFIGKSEYPDIKPIYFYMGYIKLDISNTIPVLIMINSNIDDPIKVFVFTIPPVKQKTFYIDPDYVLEFVDRRFGTITTLLKDNNRYISVHEDENKILIPMQMVTQHPDKILENNIIYCDVFIHYNNDNYPYISVEDYYRKPNKNDSTPDVLSMQEMQSKPVKIDTNSPVNSEMFVTKGKSYRRKYLPHHTVNRKIYQGMIPTLVKNVPINKNILIAGKNNGDGDHIDYITNMGLSLFADELMNHNDTKTNNDITPRGGTFGGAGASSGWNTDTDNTSRKDTNTHCRHYSSNYDNENSGNSSSDSFSNGSDTDD